MTMNPAFSERLLCGVVALAAIGSLGWFGGKLRRGNPVTPTPKLAPAVYVPAVLAATATEEKVWAPPPAQRRGQAWIYDVFTPPEVFYDAGLRRFSVTPPRVAAPETAAPFGLELVRVERKWFPLQLVGFAGGPGRYRGVFENIATGETFLAAAGRDVAELGLTITDFDVRRMPLELPDSTVTAPLAAIADVHDRDGTVTRLTSVERRHDDGWTAVVAAPESPSELHELREGASLTLGAVRYTLEKIHPAQPAIDVARQSDDRSEPSVRTLTVRAGGVAGPLPLNP